MLSPTDIKNKEFRRSFFGYECKEVDDFRQIVVENYEMMLRKDWSLRDGLPVTKEGRRLLTALEIHNKEFRRVFRGYDVDEVNYFLDLVIQSMEELIIKKQASDL